MENFLIGKPHPDAWACIPRDLVDLKFSRKPYPVSLDLKRPSRLEDFLQTSSFEPVSQETSQTWSFHGNLILWACIPRDLSDSKFSRKPHPVSLDPNRPPRLEVFVEISSCEPVSQETPPRIEFFKETLSCEPVSQDIPPRLEVFLQTPSLCELS